MSRQFVLWIVGLSFLSPAIQASAAPKFRWFKPEVHAKAELAIVECENGLMAPLRARSAMTELEAFQQLRSSIPKLVSQTSWIQDDLTWNGLLENYLAPYFEHGIKELVLSFVGPANSGKSVLFNRIADPARAISEMAPRPGSTSRPVILVPQTLQQNDDRVSLRFGSTVNWKNEHDSALEGPPLLKHMEIMPENLILIDNPSYDIGKPEGLTDLGFIWSDILFYVFSDSNFKNVFNVNYLREKIRSVGGRPIVFIYRTSTPLSDEEVFKHVSEVVEGIAKPGDPPLLVLGTFTLVLKDNQPELVPRGESPPLDVFLGELNQKSEYHRKSSIGRALGHVLDHTAHRLVSLQRRTEEDYLSRQVLKVHVQQRVTDLVNGLDTSLVLKDLEIVWRHSSSGFKSVLDLWSFPERHLQKRRASLLDTSDSVTSFMSQANQGLEQILGSVQDVLKLARVQLQKNGSEAAQLLTEIDEFRAAYSLSGEEKPYALIQDERVEIETIGVIDLQLDWSRTSDSAKLKAQDLTREKIRDALRQARIIEGQVRSEQKVATVLRRTGALAPLVFTTGYVLSEFQDLSALSLVTLLGISHLSSRGFTYLDDSSIREEWRIRLDAWIKSELRERLQDVLIHELGLNKEFVNPVQDEEFDRLQLAIETLGQFRH